MRGVIGRLDRRRVEHERVGIDVDEDGRRALVEHHVGRRDERDRRRDDLVARADAGGAHQQVQAGRAARDGDGVLAAAERRELASRSGARTGRAPSMPERSASSTYSSSRGPTSGRESGIWRAAWTLHALAGVAAG